MASVLSGEPAMGRTVSIQLPLIPFSKLHHWDEVPMATKHESVSTRVQGLAESTHQTSRSRSGGRCAATDSHQCPPPRHPTSPAVHSQQTACQAPLSKPTFTKRRGPGQHPLMAQRRLAADPSTSKSPIISLSQLLLPPKIHSELSAG